MKKTVKVKQSVRNGKVVKAHTRNIVAKDLSELRSNYEAHIKHELAARKARTLHNDRPTWREHTKAAKELFSKIKESQKAFLRKHGKEKIGDMVNNYSKVEKKFSKGMLGYLRNDRVSWLKSKVIKPYIKKATK